MDIVDQSPLETVQPKNALFSGSRVKFLVGGLLIVAAVVYLIWTSASANSQYFLTVDELKAKGASIVGRDVRVSGAILGDSIQYDPQTLTLEFVVAHTPGSNAEVEAQGGLAAVLHEAVVDPNRAHIKVIYSGVKPDLMRNEAQAIMTGKMDSDGVFHANELLLKCPTRYEEAVPNQMKDSSAK